MCVAPKNKTDACYLFLLFQNAEGQSEEKAQGNISLKTYFKFFFAGANYLVLLLILVLFFLAEVRCLCLSLFRGVIVLASV